MSIFYMSSLMGIVFRFFREIKSDFVRLLCSQTNTRNNNMKSCQIPDTHSAKLALFVGIIAAVVVTVANVPDPRAA